MSKGYVLTNDSGTPIVNFPYACFSDSTTQAIANASNAQAIALDTDEVKNKITHSTVTNNSRITFDEAGVYTVEVAAQADLTSGTNQSFYMWIRIDGVDVARSGILTNLVSANDEKLISQEYIVTVTAGQYVEVVMGGSSTNLQLIARASGVTPTRPATPSIIVTVTSVSK
jgi:hypothetical protein